MKLIQIEENIGGQQYKGPSNYFINFEGKTKIRPKNALGAYSLAKNIEKKLKPGDEVTVKADWSSTPLAGHVIEVRIKKLGLTLRRLTMSHFGLFHLFLNFYNFRSQNGIEVTTIFSKRQNYSKNIVFYLLLIRPKLKING